MRKRLSSTQRRAAILNQANVLFSQRGTANTEMEDIRQACKLSRGGLYHHFSNKRAILDALIEQEVLELVEIVTSTPGNPLANLVEAGSTHLSQKPSLLNGLASRAERLEYLSGLEEAFTKHLEPALCTHLQGAVRDGVPANHVAQLFLTINGQINRREILGEWSTEYARSFAVSGLSVLAPLLKSPEKFDPILAKLRTAGDQT